MRYFNSEHLLVVKEKSVTLHYNIRKAMDINELYRLYRKHPCITTDSRNCPEGSIFLALKGASFNGNKFAKAA